MSRAIQQQQAEPREDFPALLRRSEAEFGKVIRDPAMVERFMRVALTEFRTRPELMECSPGSLMASVMLAAQLNLEIGGTLKQGYLIPYKKECSFQPSYIGLLELARRSGEFRDIDARIVYEKDQFDFAYNPRPNLFHKPLLWNAGPALGVYVFATLANGEPKFLAMDLAEIEKIRKCSKNPNGDPWNKWWGEKAKCSVLRRFLKTCRLTPHLAMAIEADEREFVTEGGEIVKAAPAALPSGSRSAGLAARLAGQAEAPAVAAIEGPEGLDPEDYGGEVAEGEEG